MAKKTAENLPAANNEVPFEELSDLEKGYLTQLESDPQYSLEVDPTNKYNMSEKQKDFIKYYVQFKNVPLASQLCDITEKEGKQYYLSFTGQQEIRRINLAMYHRQFSARLLDINEIGGYLSSILMDTNVAIADRLSPKDKLEVAKMIINLNEMKRKTMSNPLEAEYTDLGAQMKNLSVKSIKQLLDTANNPDPTHDDKTGAIEKLNADGHLSPEELAYLNTLSLDQLLDLIEKGNET